MKCKPLFAPPERYIANMIKDLNECLDGPMPVALTYDPERWDTGPWPGWGLEEPGYDPGWQCGFEELRGDGKRINHVGCARRLLAAFRDSN